MKSPAYTYRAVVESVYDGDTFRANVDLGLDIWQMKQPFRLYGINAPELRGAESEIGKQSRDWLRSKMIIGSRVIIVTRKERKNPNQDSKEKYGRYLAEVYIEGEELSLNEQMVNLGYAVPYMLT